METTYKLKPDLTWHDGKPLTADDFVFGYQVYSVKTLGGTFFSTPQDQMDDVSAGDPRTLVIKWRNLYPLAGTLTTNLFEPLPRHILEGPFASFQQDPSTLDSFLSLPFWTVEYVGADPFKVEQWEPG